MERGIVPVGLHAFESRSTVAGVEISWSTVSENENVGFYLWGDTGRKFELLTPEMIPSKAGDVMTSRDYSVVIPTRTMGNVQDLIITAVDQSGDEEMYGMFSIGGAYGRDALAAPIDWAGIRTEAEQNLARLGLTLDGQSIQRNVLWQPDAVDFQVQAAGMQRVTYDDLIAAGLDLRGVAPKHIAVTLNGEPVPRKVHSARKTGQRASINRRAGSTAAAVEAPSVIDSSFVVDFWGEMPPMPDALYVDNYNYRISVDPARARDLDEYAGRRLIQEASFYWRTISVEEDNAYAMTSVMDDPWYMKRLRAGHSSDSFVTSIDLPADSFPGQPAFLNVRVAGVTDFPQAPDHQVEVYFNGERVETVEFDGRVERLIRVDLGADALPSGRQQIEVRLPGGTDAPADLVFLDSISVTYAAALRASNERLMIEAIDANRAFTVAGLDANTATAYAWDGARLVELPLERANRANVRITPEADSAARIWISDASAINRPVHVGGASASPLVSGSPDLMVIAHPAFMPVGAFETHPLNDYIAQRESQGWVVEVVDVTAIQARFTNGMPLPQAVTQFLKETRKARNPFQHVLLVGGDSYDYHDRLGIGSLSFIPTLYGNTRYVPHSPSDALMSDVDGDGLGDLAVGRWPVRSMGDLESIVQKTLDWDANMVGQQTALWAADTEDPNIASFAGQVERMLSPLRDAGWSDSGFDTIQVGADQFDSADAARIQFFKLLQEGRALTGYTGHGSAGVWSFQGFLFPSDLAQLNNDGFPTLIGTMACYTSYFSSPSNDTVAHRWMNGFRLDLDGQPVPGAPNGAIAVHGAATLSNYAQNEIFASEVIGYQLEGMTLGEAVRAAREEARRRGINDLVVNWTLLGDPTVRLLDQTSSRP